MTIDTTLLDAARRIAPVIRAYREQAERERCLPTPVVEAMAEAGLLRMVTPRSLGGPGGGPADLRAGDRRSRADG